MPKSKFDLWGSELSPFALKLAAMLDHAEIPYRWLPDAGGRFENLRTAFRLERAKRRRAVRRYGGLSPLDEYPAVPFLVQDGRRFHYDTTALAGWLDVRPERRGERLLPEAPGLAFVARLLDEAFDEIGLYLVHHHRWVTSAATNDAGRRLAHEFRRVLPPGFQGRMARRFAARQVRRLPYLFSVAPEGFDCGVAPELTPPARAGFPETHALLEAISEQWLDGVEAVLTRQPYLLGERFTLADASVYGQLGMNLKDPTAAERMRDRAPTTWAWLCDIRDGRHAGSHGELGLAPSLRPLLAAVSSSFVPLMRQNEAAYEAALAAGETRFNEPAFDRGRALYEGKLHGRPFRSVVKTFQVRAWRDLVSVFDALPEGERATLRAGLPSWEAG